MKKIIFSTLMLGLGVSLFANPQYNTTTDACFKNREIVYPLQEVFDALKQTLMQSNLNIVTVTKEDGILTAKGTTTHEDEDTMTDVTITVDFKERQAGITSVKVIASYATQELKSDTGQIGGAGISLPIPVPFTGKYTLVSRGNIDDPLWYQGFFSSLEKILFENYMKYSTVDTPVVEETKAAKIEKEVTQELEKKETKQEVAKLEEKTEPVKEEKAVEETKQEEVQAKEEKIEEAQEESKTEEKTQEAQEQTNTEEKVETTQETTTENQTTTEPETVEANVEETTTEN